MTQRSVATRSLWPREHGAYIQLLIPLVTALIATHPGPAAGALALAAALAFVASEPLRVLLGDRGPRMQELAARRARWRLGALGASALIAGGLGLGFGPRAALWAALLVTPPIGVLVVAARRRTLDTFGGELAAAVALCGAGAPVAVAGGMPIGAAILMWGAWSLAYATTVIAVHHVIARHRKARPAGHARRSGVLVCVGLATLIAIEPTAWFAAPLIVVALAVIALTPPATRLRAIGFTFLAASTVSAVCGVAVFRGRGCALEPTSPPPRASCVSGRSAPSLFAARTHLQDDLGLDLRGQRCDRGKDDAFFELEVRLERSGECGGGASEPCRGPVTPSPRRDVIAHRDEVMDAGCLHDVIVTHRGEGRAGLRARFAQAGRDGLVLVREVQGEGAREITMDIGGDGGRRFVVDSVAGREPFGAAQERTDSQVAFLEQVDKTFLRTTPADREEH
ncbi:MAG: YwiC-like family protein [Kofleriaceae bacterium]